MGLSSNEFLLGRIRKKVPFLFFFFIVVVFWSQHMGFRHDLHMRDVVL